VRVWAAAALVAIVAPALAQQEKPLRIEPPEDAAYGFVIDRRVSVRRGPGYTYDEPRKRKVVSIVRVRPMATESVANVALEVTFLRVHGYEDGGDLTQEITFDRGLDDPHSGRPETLVVGRSVQIETQRDGTFVAIRGIDEAMPGNEVAATSVIADLRALVAQLPPTAAARSSWTTNSLEGRGLLRSRIEATHTMENTTDAEVRIAVKGKLAAAPEGAGPSFERSFRVTRGERTAQYRVSRLDGLPLDGRVTTAYAVEARLSGSDLQVGVDSETIVNVRRTAAPDDPAAAAGKDPKAPTPGGETPNRGLPGWLGTSRDVILRLAGEPTRSGGGLAGGSFDTFGGLGLIYEYDDDGFVKRVTATKTSGREPFAGKVLGVGLGDALSKAIELWGPCTSQRETKWEFREAEWVFDTLHIEIEAWKKDGSDPAFGDYEANAVKRIRVSNRATD
jgi:hypothetical protein